MYTVTIAARISHSVLVSVPWKASAAPWKESCTLAGIPSSSSTALMALTALPEGVVDRVVGRRGRHAEPGGGIAVDLDVGREPLILQVARHVRELRERLHARHERLGPHRELVHVRVLGRQGIERAADARIDGEVLHRLHVHRDARDQGQPGLQAADDAGGLEAPLTLGPGTE